MIVIELPITTDIVLFVAEKRPLHKFLVYCFDCKQHFEYRKPSKTDALKEFDSFGHNRQKIAQTKRNLGRMKLADRLELNKRKQRRGRERGRP